MGDYGTIQSRRVHGINGYFDLAPASDKDDQVITDFFYYATKGTLLPASSIKDSWKLANSKMMGTTNWATLVHRGNANNFLPGQPHGLTSDTSGPPVFDLYQRFNTVHSLPTVVSGSSIWGAQKVVNSKHTKFKMLQPFAPKHKQLSALHIAPWEADRKAVSKKLVGNTAELLEGIDKGRHVVRNHDKVAETDDSGLIEYRDLSVSLDKMKRVRFDEAQAIEKARSMAHRSRSRGSSPD